MSSRINISYCCWITSCTGCRGVTRWFVTNLLQKLIFRSGILCYPIADADIEQWKSQDLSIHYLISIWNTCWWNKIPWSEPHKILWFVCLFVCFWLKIVNSFWQSVDAIWRRFCAWKNCFMLKYSFKDHHL